MSKRYACTLTLPDQVFKAADGLTLRFGEQSVMVYFHGNPGTKDLLKGTAALLEKAASRIRDR